MRSLDPDSIGARILLNQGQWTAEAGTGDISATAPGLLPFVVHETKCTQPQQRDPAARQRAREACNAAPWGLIGYFLDPALFEMLARTAQLSLPAEPFHAPRWREATMHDFTVSVHHVMRVGHLASPMVWRSLLYPSPARLPLAWNVTQLPLPMPHDLPSPKPRPAHTACRQPPGCSPGLEEALPSGSWLPSCLKEVPEQLVDWRAAHALSASRDLHLLSLAVGVLLSLLTHKTELIVRGVYGAGKTQCIALLAAFFALRGHQVYYASRENTTIVAMATFVQELLPRAPDDAWPMAIRLLSHTQARTSESTDLDARDTDKNQQIWNAKLVVATTGLHLAQFRQPHRPLAKAVDYADLFIYDEAQQEAALSDLAILDALPRNCLVLRLGDPKQTSGGTGPSDLARQVRLVSDQLALGIRAPRKPCLPQAIPALIQSLLQDDLPHACCPVSRNDAMVDPACEANADGALPSGRKPSTDALMAA